MSNSSHKITTLKETRRVKLDSSVDVDKLTREEKIKRNNFFEIRYPFEEHGL